MADLDQLEADLALEREELRARLSAVSVRLAPERLAAEAAAAAGHVVGRGLGRTKVRQTAPVLASVLSLAWAAGTSVAAAWRQQGVRPYDTTPRPTASGFRRAPVDPANFDARVARVDAAIRQELTSPNLKGAEAMTTNADPSDTARTAANGTMKDRAQATAEALRARLEDGLDGLPDAAKQRVRQAREAAVAAQSEIEAGARQAADAARTAARDNPLLVGALAFAAGAAIAAALPRTSIENHTLGVHRDRLFDDAERIYREERAALASAAEEAVATGRKNAKATLAGDTPAEKETTGSKGSKTTPGKASADASV